MPVFFFVVVLGIMTEILSAKFQFTNQRVALVPKETHKAQIRLPVTSPNYNKKLAYPNILCYTFCRIQIYFIKHVLNKGKYDKNQ